MTRRVWWLLAFVGVFLVIGTGAAVADDCSSPTDCSNTAWTVGGGAAVAGAIIAAAAATGLIPSSPTGAVDPTTGQRNELSPECLEALNGLLDAVHDEFAYLAELQGTIEGANRMANNLDEWIGAGQNAFGDPTSGTTPGASVPHGDLTGIGTATYDRFREPNLARATGVLSPAAAARAQQGFARAARADSLRAIAEGRKAAGETLRRLLDSPPPMTDPGYDKWARMYKGALETEFQAAKLAREAEALAGSADEMIQGARLTGQTTDDLAAAAGAGGKITRFGTAMRGVGVLGGVYSAYGSRAAVGGYRSRSHILRARGEGIARIDAAEGEQARWDSFSRQLSDRRAARLEVLNRKISAYNRRASACGAEMIPLDAGNLLASARQAARAGAGRGGRVPERIVEPRRRDIREQREASQGCSTYPADVRAAERVAWDVVADLQKWLDREGDLAATKAGFDRAIADLEGRDPSSWFVGGQTSAAALSVSGVLFTVAGVAISWPVAVAMGVTSIVLSLGSEVMKPEDFHHVLVGKTRQMRGWLDTRSPYINSEIHRLRELFNNDVAQRLRELHGVYSECVNAGVEGLQPPSDLSVFKTAANRAGRALPIEEIRTWR
ncbi:MAG: hypothetical protein GY720_03740 [bacterium]|nr:hypothetical protein [bacterium]